MVGERQQLSSEPLRWLISGYYGAGNLGDEALLAGILGALREAGVAATVASLNPAVSRTMHGVAAVHRLWGLPTALWRAQAVISGGGGLLQDTTSGRSLSYYLGVVRAARALRRPVAVFAQSLGPLSARGAAEVQRVLAGVPLGLRDRPSLALAAELGLNAVAVADTALLLTPPTPPTARDERMLVLVPRAGQPAIGDLLATLGALHIASGGRVRIALVHPEQDAAEGERLARLLPAAERPTIHSVGDLQRALQGVAAVISGRLHGLILAAASGSPAAGLAYDPKVTGFAEAIGAPVFPLTPGASQTERERAEAGLQRFLAAPTLDQEAVSRERERAAAGVRWLIDEALQLHRNVGA
jgi:polysaccharide pyruvyl transferase CsaB